MRKYKNYYICEGGFKSKKEIDDFIKQKHVDSYVMYIEMFANKASMELVCIISELADKLVKQFGFTYSELEDLEIATFKAL